MISCRSILAEFLGSTGLLIAVVGSGIMGESLAQGNVALVLLANSLATSAGLYALIQAFGPISGAHFNPAVSLAEYFWKKISWRTFVTFVVAQIAGAVLGVFFAHAMFGQDIFQLSRHERAEPRFLLSEALATSGLILVIALSGKKGAKAVPSAVALYIAAAYWCTSSTSFANPAATLARSLTDTFSGVMWNGVLGFIGAQMVGVFLGLGLSRLFKIESMQAAS